MAKNVCCTGLCSQDNPVESLGNSPSAAHPSSAEQEVDAPGAAQIPVLHVDNQLPLTASNLSQANEATEKNSQGAVGHTDNPSASTETPIDAGTLVQHPGHGHVPPGDADNENNSVGPQNGSFEDDGGLFNTLNGSLPTACAEDVEGDLLDNDLDPPLNEEEDESDQEDYSEFTPEEVLHRLHEYKSAYYAVRRQRNDAESENADFQSKHGELMHACDTQEEFLQSVQQESDNVKCNLEHYQQCTELQMNKESVAHQLRILQFNECMNTKQFQEEELQRTLHEAQWKQKENDERLKVLLPAQCLQRPKVATRQTAAPTAQSLPNLLPPPRKEQAVAGAPQVLTAEQKQAQHEALVIAKETAYRQLIANTAADMYGPQATALQAECTKLHAEYNRLYLSSATQGSTSALVAAQGAGASTSSSTSMPPPPRLAPIALSAPVETPEQKKVHQRKQLDQHWRQVQKFLSTCPMDQTEKRQKAYEDYLAAFEQFEVEFPLETPPVSTARQRREAGAADASVHFATLPHQPSTVDLALRWQIFQNSSLLAHYDPLAPTLHLAHSLPMMKLRSMKITKGSWATTHPHDFQLSSDWYDPNQGGYYQPLQDYLSPDPAVQNAFDQERYATQLTNYSG